MTVLDIARESVVTHAPEDPVVDALGSMREEGVSSVVLVEGDRPTGIVTDRILALQLDRDRDLEDLSLADVPTEDVEPIEAGSGVYELLEHMADHGARRIPVVEDGALVGIISISDVVVLLGMELQHVANVLRTTSPAYERAPTDVYE